MSRGAWPAAQRPLTPRTLLGERRFAMAVERQLPTHDLNIELCDGTLELEGGEARAAAVYFSPRGLTRDLTRGAPVSWFRCRLDSAGEV